MEDQRPQWVVSALCEILGFDDGTVKEAILPELEGQTNQVKLKSHLQDFLGPSSAAKAFIDRYISYRFASVPSAPSHSSHPNVKLPKTGNHSRAALAPDSNSRSTQLDTARLDAAFGPSGTVYLKNRDADDLSSKYGGPSPSGSGSNTPQFRHPNSQAGQGGHHPHESPRPAGNLVVHEAKVRSAGHTVGDAKGKGKDEKVWDLPRSKEVKKLDDLRDRLLELQAGQGKVVSMEPVYECFCQARNHPLSIYTPHCPHCGLVICTIHPAYVPCPSCHNPLLSPAQLSRLLLRLESDIEIQLTIEKAGRDSLERERRERHIAESGGGAFPTLAGGPPRPTPVPIDQPIPRKVLTIGGGKGKGKGRSVITSTTYRPSPSPSAPAQTSTPPPDRLVPRPRSPPPDQGKMEKEWNKLSKWREEEDRPWGDMKGDKRGGGWAYVELPISLSVQDHEVGRRKAAKQKHMGEGRGVEGRVVPGAAG